jgi:hypothetical protein
MLNIIWQSFLSDPEYYVMGALAVAETVTRLTPTKKDDGFIQRIGSVVNRVFDLVKIPNRMKGKKKLL